MGFFSLERKGRAIQKDFGLPSPVGPILVVILAIIWIKLEIIPKVGVIHSYLFPRMIDVPQCHWCPTHSLHWFWNGIFQRCGVQTMPKDVAENFKRNLTDWCHDVRRVWVFEVFLVLFFCIPRDSKLFIYPFWDQGDLSISTDSRGMLSKPRGWRRARGMQKKSCYTRLFG